MRILLILLGAILLGYFIGALVTAALFMVGLIGSALIAILTAPFVM